MTAVLLNPNRSPGELPRPEPVGDPVAHFTRHDDAMERAIYLHGRQSLDDPTKRVDGFQLYSAPYREGLDRSTVLAAFEAESTQPGFSYPEFVARHYDLSKGVLPTVEAPRGMAIETFITNVLKPLQERDLSGYTDDGPHLALPKTAYAPGGRFKGPFPHDDHYVAMDPNRIFNVLDNQAHQIFRYGYPFNFTDVASAGRTQTPFFSYIVERAVSQHENGAEILQHYLEPMVRYFNFFERDQARVGAHNPAYRRALLIPGSTKNHRLARHHDDMPVKYDPNPELRVGGRRESYWEDHHHAELAIHGIASEARRKELWERHMISTGAIGESCYDFSALRWSRDGKSLHELEILDIAPLELNANLIHMARLIAMAYEARGDSESLHWAMYFRKNAEDRAFALNELGYDPQTGAYHDIHKSGRRTRVASAAMGAVLYAGGIAPPDRAMRTIRYMHRMLLKPYGLQTTHEQTTQQWDGTVWAGPAYQAGEGALLTAYEIEAAGGDGTEAAEAGEQIFSQTSAGIQASFDALRTLPERFRGTEPRVSLKLGEYPEARNLAMTGDVYLEISGRRPTQELRTPEVSPRRLTIASAVGGVGLRGGHRQ